MRTNDSGVREALSRRGWLGSDAHTDSSTCVRPTGPAMEQGRATTAFLVLALILDLVGLVLFFVGIFAPLSFWDFFVLSGPLLIFLSLILWIFWYLGNLKVSDEELNLVKPDIL